MKKLLASLLLIAGMVPATAADLPVKASPSPFIPTTDPFTGLYIGARIGYGFDLGAFGFGPANITDLAGSPQGFVGGIHGGLGTRFASIWYIGIEGDFDGANVKGSGSLPGVITADSKNTFLCSIRGRF